MSAVNMHPEKQDRNYRDEAATIFKTANSLNQIISIHPTLQVYLGNNQGL